jgi:protein SCO1/2
LTPASSFRFRRLLLGGALGLVAVLVWMRAWKPETSPGEEGTDYFLSSPLPAPEFSLTSQEGSPVSSRDFPGEVLVVFFGYTSCPDVCPLTLSNLARAIRGMGEDADRVQVLFITVDPARDTAERLKAYLSNFHPSFLGLTGPMEDIRWTADGFGAYFSNPGGEGNYTVEHTARTFVVDPSGRIPLTFPITATPEEMARDLATLLRRFPS